MIKMKPKGMMGLLALVMAIGIFSSPSWAFQVVNDPLSGDADWLADVRFRNFRDTGGEINQTWEMSVNANPTRAFLTSDPLLTTGDLPGGYSAMWAENNNFWITYNPSINSVSLRLAGSGGTSYDVTISRAPDGVVGPVNYIEFSLWDRDTFGTLPGGLTLSALDGSPVGSFTLSAAGIDSWAILDPSGLTLNDGFILNGSFTVDPSKLVGGTETDKIIFGIGNHPSVVPIPGAVWLFGSALVCFAGLRKKLRKA